MTPWGLRKRLRAWLFDQLVGEMLHDVKAEAEPEPVPEVEYVDLMADDTPLLSDVARQMIADPHGPAKAAIPAVEAVPLAGSVEERLARFRLR